MSKCVEVPVLSFRAPFLLISTWTCLALSCIHQLTIAHVNQLSPSEESEASTSIVAGSFATVYSVRGLSCVLKPSVSPISQTNFMQTYMLCKSCIPSATLILYPPILQPIAYYSPGTKEFLQFPQSHPIRRPQDPRPILDSNLFTNEPFDAPSYALDRAYVLPTQIPTSIHDLFYNTNARN